MFEDETREKTRQQTLLHNVPKTRLARPVQNCRMTQQTVKNQFGTRLGLLFIPPTARWMLESPESRWAGYIIMKNDNDGLQLVIIE